MSEVTLDIAKRLRQLAEAHEDADDIRRAARFIEDLHHSLDELVISSNHARIFLTSREKMHPVGVELYDEAIARANVNLTAVENWDCQYWHAGNEQYVDENGTVWTRPTAEAYALICKAHAALAASTREPS